MSIQCVVFGGSSVGKTAFIAMFCTTLFVENYDSCDSIFRKIIIFNNKPLVLDFIDTFGPNENWPVIEHFIANKERCILIYSITDRKSFDLVGQFWSLIRKENRSTYAYLVGNKTDLEKQRQVSEEEGREMANQMGILFAECSATDFESVSSIIHEFTKLTVNISTIPSDLRK